MTTEDWQSAKAVNFGLIDVMGAKGLKRYADVVYGLDLTLGAHAHASPFVEILGKNFLTDMPTAIGTGNAP